MSLFAYVLCAMFAIVVQVALGSDFVGWDPTITAREFRLLVECAGMSPLEAIRAGTVITQYAISVLEPTLPRVDD